VKVDISVFLENMSRISKFHQIMTRITGTLHEDQNTLFIISRSFLLRIRNVSETVVEKIKTRYTFNNLFPKIVAFYEVI